MPKPSGEAAANPSTPRQRRWRAMHHLWPSVPFYNYARLYRALRPVLVAEGSRIEGLMVGPHARSRA